jgi:hypothetical protein
VSILPSIVKTNDHIKLSYHLSSTYQFEHIKEQGARRRGKLKDAAAPVVAGLTRIFHSLCVSLVGPFTSHEITLLSYQRHV